MSFFISPAMAETGAAGPGGDLSGLIFLVGFAAIFYFMVWRPQSKRAKEHKALVADLSKGDEVVTSAGLLGKVTKIDEDYVVLSVSDNVELKFQKMHIAAALPKGTIKDI
ncbi:preprotein translocase subunit YajC [Motiliproteus coralliicola]|uniref:Sec translocon accessory complex subunit YajC n=1 Tax=Motiliproteus coralliicola TaxID=2283196 RepID=A0A369W8W2_9GAMM|nr:preprotein translocase subunit YajC [Motiliproteus coralliicola]RDE18428.1 preprotein translocase subunit YajC [Motiliproteus coralliicola]